MGVSPGFFRVISAIRTLPNKPPTFEGSPLRGAFLRFNLPNSIWETLDEIQKFTRIPSVFVDGFVRNPAVNAPVEVGLSIYEGFSTYQVVFLDF